MGVASKCCRKENANAACGEVLHREEEKGSGGSRIRSDFLRRHYPDQVQRVSSQPRRVCEAPLRNNLEYTLRDGVCQGETVWSAGMNCQETTLRLPAIEIAPTCGWPSACANGNDGVYARFGALTAQVDAWRNAYPARLQGALD